ncbi:uncharacterized protein LOC135948571 [Cloeon dipterum]|uniref:uncharacterized protein LOC135948571 n=1 Tax=Cloeon dipterum TaxID=197152 RepID=UPI00321F78EB
MVKNQNPTSQRRRGGQWHCGIKCPKKVRGRGEPESGKRTSHKITCSSGAAHLAPDFFYIIQEVPDCFVVPAYSCFDQFFSHHLEKTSKFGAAMETLVKKLGALYLDKATSWMPIWFEMDPEKLRILGNDCFARHDYFKAISCFTKSLARSPAGSRLRGLAYANRSAVLLTLGHYKESLADVQTALANDYPKEMVKKLHLRMAVCKKMMGMTEEAEEDFREAFTDTPKATIEGHKPALPVVPVEYVDPPKLSYGKSALDPLISSALLIVKEDGAFVAKRKIEIGDVLLVEPPLACSTHCCGIFGESNWIYCSECLKMCLNLMPCSSCSWDLYCSKKCSKLAWDKYHSSYCVAKKEVLEKICELGHPIIITIPIFVLPLLSLISTVGLKNCIISSDEPEQSLNVLFNARKTRTALEFPFVHVVIELIADSFQLKGEIEQKFIVFMKKALDEILARGEYVKHSAIAFINDSDEMSFGQQLVGWGFYPRAAAIVNSCKPNVYASFFQKTLVLRATRPIEEGEELFKSSNGKFSFCPAGEQQMRKSVSLNCNCVSCINNMKLYEDLSAELKYIGFDEYQWEFHLQYKADFASSLDRFHPVSTLTTENYKKCVEIFLKHGEEKRDGLDLKTVEFFEQYFTFLSIKLGVGEQGKKPYYLIPN